MFRAVAHCKRVIAAEKAHPSSIYTNHPSIYFLCNSTASFSSSSRIYRIRKRRKWRPIQPYKTDGDQNFAFQLATQSLKQSIRKSKTTLLSDLINSFAAFEIEPTPQSYHFLFKILIRNRPVNCHDQLRQILSHIEKVEKFETPECIFIDLINFYGDNYMFNDAVELFFSIPRYYRCDPSVEVLNALISVLCRNKLGLEMVPGVLIKSQMMNIRIEQSSFGILIRALCRIGRLSNAYELLNHMVEEGFGVDQKVCSLMLATMCRQWNCEDGGEIMGFLEDLNKLGFEPRRDDFCNLIKFLVKRGKGVDALGILKQMKMNGVKPDIMCYNLVLDGLIHNGDFSSADKVFDELLVRGLPPDIYTYNVYINGLCEQKKVEDGIKMMGSMEDLGCAPDLITYSTILRALCATGELDRVREVVNEMQQKSMKLSSQIYEILIDGFISNGDIGRACGFLNEMLDKNLVPQQVTLDKVMCWLCKNGLQFRAVELLAEVERIIDLAKNRFRAVELLAEVERIVDLAKNRLQADDRSPVSE